MPSGMLCGASEFANFPKKKTLLTNTSAPQKKPKTSTTEPKISIHAPTVLVPKQWLTTRKRDRSRTGHEIFTRSVAVN
jgi:hypothetical protein